jgi:hypothetical protein
MTTAKWTSIQEGSRIYPIVLCYPSARFNEKGYLQVWGGDALIGNWKWETNWTWKFIVP